MQARPYLVGIAGGSGSGKTSLIRALRDQWPAGHVSVVSQDDYYHHRSLQATDQNGRINYDLPTAVDLDALTSDLHLLRQGATVERMEYTFNQDGREPGRVVVHPARLVFIEGLFVLHDDTMRSLFDLRVFVDADEEVQLARRLRRDEVERGYGRAEVLYQWHHHVLPAYRTWLLPHRGSCELVVRNDRALPEVVSQLQTDLRIHMDRTAISYSEFAQVR